MSTPGPYDFAFKRISGAQYHKVTTSWVNVLIGIPIALARPKSANFKFPSSSIKRFYGFRSL